MKLTPIYLTVRPLYFRLIEAGKKVVEGRLKEPSLDTLKIEQEIRFREAINPRSPISRTPKELRARIVYLKNYPTFRDMLKQEGLDRCLPGIKTLDEGVNIYHGFPSYQENEKKYGVLAIGIQLIKG